MPHDLTPSLSRAGIAVGLALNSTTAAASVIAPGAAAYLTGA